MIRKTFSVLLLAGLCFQAFAQGKKVTLEDVWKRYEFYAQSTSALNSMNDGQHYAAITKTDNGPTLEKFSYKTGESVGLIISAKVIEEQTGKRVNFVDYEFSPNEDKVLLATDQESIYRHSSKSRYYVYDLKNGKLDSLATEGKQQLATFSPTRNQVAFVKDNRLHIQDFDSDSRELISFGKGEDDAFIAGAVDWVYEEEFSFHKGFEWSPNGDYIAYYQTDEREVPLFTMDIFGKGLYPSEDEFKYPKAGEPNSDVSIHLFDVKKQEDAKVEISQDYEYIPRIKWTKDDEELVIYTMNRLQNQLTLWKVEAAKASASVLYQENAPSYIEISDDLRFFKDGSFIWTSEQDGYKHIYHMDKKGAIKKQITKGDWEVTEFYGIDEDSKTLYYQAAEESPMERAVYSIKLDGSGKKKLSTKKGWNDAEFSKGFKYYINTYSSKDVPTLETLHNSKGEQLRVITDNAKLKEKLRSYDIAQKDFFKFKNEEGTELNGWMIKPQDFEEGKKYPVLMFVYGGPGSQTVKNQYDGFNHFYYQSLANQGYIIVSVDNRGTGARGRDFRTVTYKQLGKFEIEDQISGAKYLGTLPYVDKKRIGIWGWSYGGYMSSLGITKGADVFTMAIAVAPVTNWRFYDSIYTERYMDTPQNNGNGYDDNSPINHVGKLEGKYLLIHGSADDNVHVQNTMRMISALVDADKQFDLFIYPDKNHGIYGGNTRYHLYKMMNDFILKNL